MITKYTNSMKVEMILAVEYKKTSAVEKEPEQIRDRLDRESNPDRLCEFYRTKLKSWWKFRNRVQFLISKDMLPLSYKVIVRWNIHKLQTNYNSKIIRKCEKWSTKYRSIKMFLFKPREFLCGNPRKVMLWRLSLKTASSTVLPIY